MDLMVGITYITWCITAELGEKIHIPKKQENLDLRAKSINTNHSPNHFQAYFLSAVPPPQVNANYF